MQVKNNILSPLTGWSTWVTILRNCGSMFIELVGNDECWLSRFHTIRNFLANEIYHFSRLSHETGCLFTWTADSKKSAYIQPTLLVPECHIAKNIEAVT